MKEENIKLNKNTVRGFAGGLLIGLLITIVYVGVVVMPNANLEGIEQSLGVRPVPEIIPTVSAQSLDEFAQCLTEKDVVMYGAHWCPWCERQEQLFGFNKNGPLNSFEYIEYIECAEGAPSDWPYPVDKAKCGTEQITGYPTWKYNGETRSGLQELSSLASWTGCALSE